MTALNGKRTLAVLFMITLGACKPQVKEVVEKQPLNDEATNPTNNGEANQTKEVKNTEPLEDQGADVIVDSPDEVKDPVPPPANPVERVLDCDPVTFSCLGYQSLTGVPKGNLFYSDMQKYGTALTQESQKCNWARRPQIYLFPDGVVYTAINVDTYNFYTIDVVHKYGCELPGYQNPYKEDQQLTYPGDGTTTLASLTYDIVEEGLREQPASFTEDVKKAKKVTQAQHECSFATRTLIYVFPDGVLYATPGRTDYRFYKRETVVAQGCKL